MDIHAHDFPDTLHAQLKNHLLDAVLPFWMRHAVDPAGGLNTCIRDDGTIQSRDKWGWSQWRALWVYSKLHNAGLGDRERWLEVACNLYTFMSAHGWDAKANGWALRLSGEGEILAGWESIYTDGFALSALTEYARATGEPRAVELACRTADLSIDRLSRPHHELPAFPYPVPEGVRVHGLPMIFSLPLWELGQFLDEQRYRDAALAMSDDIFTNFYRPNRDVMFEHIAEDQSELPAPKGTAIVPGHVIEDMWFQIHIAREAGQPERVAEACRLIRRHLELGWDEQYGGIFLAVDADGRDKVGWDFADSKLWWPHTEALYALLLAHREGGEPWCLEWYAKVHEYSFAHYPVAKHGEWRQRLNRRGEPFDTVVALPVKDPFHLPRALIYAVEVLGELKAK